MNRVTKLDEEKDKLITQLMAMPGVKAPGISVNVTPRPMKRPLTKTTPTPQIKRPLLLTPPPSASINMIKRSLFTSSASMASASVTVETSASDDSTSHVSGDSENHTHIAITRAEKSTQTKDMLDDFEVKVCISSLSL